MSKEFSVRIYEGNEPPSDDDKMQWTVMQPAIEEARRMLAHADHRSSIRKMALCMGLAMKELDMALAKARELDPEICELLDNITQ